MIVLEELHYEIGQTAFRLAISKIHRDSGKSVFILYYVVVGGGGGPPVVAIC
jgi:hypothetical protein